MRPWLDSVPAGSRPHDEAIPQTRAQGSAPIKERLRCL
jgi:hypothetical protein